VTTVAVDPTNPAQYLRFAVNAWKHNAPNVGYLLCTLRPTSSAPSPRSTWRTTPCSAPWRKSPSHDFGIYQHRIHRFRPAAAP